MPLPIEGYLNRHTPDRNWEEVAFRSSGFRPIYLQQAEMVEVQSIFADRIKGIADAILSDGAVVRDARIVVNSDNGDTICESGAIYVRGAVRGVPPGAFTIPTVGTITIGVRLVEEIETELESPDLLGQIEGAASFGQPGAARRKLVPSWGHSADGKAEGEFYPVYTVDNGVPRPTEPPPAIDGIRQAIARYDIDSSGGTYVISGFDVRQMPDLESGEQVYTVSAGRARVRGNAVEMVASSRVVFDAQADLRSIDSEPHASTGPAAQRINLDRAPLAILRQVRITTEKTVNIVHGAYAGASDPLPDTSVVEIVSVKQGGTTYAAGSDYRLQAGQVDWSLPGAEVGLGSTYSVTYRFITSVTPTGVDVNGFTVTGAVAGTLVLTSYDVRLPRIDRLCLDSDGLWSWVKGIAADYNPVAPTVPLQLLAVATVRQTWGADRSTQSTGTRMVSMAELQSIRSSLDDIRGQMAEVQLRGDVGLRESAYKRGVFVDPLRDDSMRDQGIAQTAAVSGGALVLPIVPTISRLPSDVSGPTTLAFTRVAAVEQIRRTGGMKINPYMAFAVPPAAVSLNPAVDRWEEFSTQYTSARTQVFDRIDPSWHGDVWGGLMASSTTVDVEQVALSSTAITTLRSIPVAFYITGFGAGERLTGVSFDGLPVATVPAMISADANGAVIGQFTVPGGIPAGRKAVIFTGVHGSRGESIFEGQGVATVQTLRQVQTTNRLFYDPLMQTFALPQTEQVVGVELFVRQKGATPVTVDFRGVEQGAPDRNIAERGRREPVAVVPGAWNAFDFSAPLLVDGNVEKSIVAMCNDPDTELAVAELGKYDSTFGWVTSQPYVIGTLGSSSNDSAWTFHQDKDLAFRIMVARYTETLKVVDLGKVAVTNATDLIVMANVEIPDAQTRIEFALTLPDGTAYTVAANQPLRLSKKVTGQVSVAAKLYGTATRAPILFPGTSLVAGAQADSGDYQGRAFPAGTNSRIVVVYDALIPGGASVAPTLKGAGAAVAAPQTSTRLLDNGWREFVHEVASLSEAMPALRMAISGSPAARPRVANIRAFALAAAQ